MANSPREPQTDQKAASAAPTAPSRATPGATPGATPSASPSDKTSTPAAAARLSITPQLLLQKAIRLIPVLFLASIFFAGLFGEQGLYQLRTLSAEQQRVEASIQEQEKLNRQYQHDVRRLQNDNRYLERLAREEMGMVRPGELVYQFKE